MDKKKMCYIYTVEDYSAIKEKLMLFAATLVDLKAVIVK